MVKLLKINRFCRHFSFNNKYYLIIGDIRLMVVEKKVLNLLMMCTSTNV